MCPTTLSRAGSSVAAPSRAGGALAGARGACSTPAVTRFRCALILLAALTWNVASPWLGLGRAAADETTVIAAAPQPSLGSEWLPGAALGEQLARLPGQDAAAPTLARLVPRPRAERPPPSIEAVPPAPWRDARRRPHMLRGGHDPDDPA